MLITLMVMFMWFVITRTVYIAKHFQFICALVNYIQSVPSVTLFMYVFIWPIIREMEGHDYLLLQQTLYMVTRQAYDKQ